MQLHLAALAALSSCSILFAADLNDLATIKPDTIYRRASSFDPNGDNMDSIQGLAPGASAVLLDTPGPGRINHLWITYKGFPNHPTVQRDLVLRMTWEQAGVPAVDVPLGDFFGQGHAKAYTLQSVPIAVGLNNRALNCYWPMPFHRHAKIEIYNNGRRSVRLIYYHVDYELGPQPADQGLFHALFRYERDLKTQVDGGNTTGKDNYVLFETEGQGQYVGCALYVDAPPGGWWGEGDDMIFIDHSEKPVVIGTGSEDYFNNAWGFNEAFSYPYYGCPLLEKRPDGGTWTSAYRWHIPDPIRFNTHIRVTLEHIYSPKVANDYSSVAFWYQRAPLASRPPLPIAEGNHPKVHPEPPRPAPAHIELDGTELEEILCAKGLAARAVATNLHDSVNGGWLKIEKLTSAVEIPIPVPADGTYRVRIKPISQVLEKPIRIRLQGGTPQTFEKQPGPESKVPYLDLGKGEAKNKTLTLIIEGAPTVGIDEIRLDRDSAPGEAQEKPDAKPAAPAPPTNNAEQ